MSVYAGIYNYDSSRPVDRDLCARLGSAANRSTENVLTEFDWPGVHVVQADIGAFVNSGYARLHDGGAIIVAGQPLFESVIGSDRSLEMERLGASISGGYIGLLRAARGSYSLACYFPREHRLLLAVDRLGVRPLYYCDDGSRVVFATSMRVFEMLSGIIRLSVDLQAVVELNAFGFPLADRTPFKEVFCLRGGEAKSWGDGKNRTQIYWRWDQIPDRQDGGENAARDLHDTFMDAIRIRCGDDRTARAFLSSGLDSRCVVTALVSLGLETHTYNMSWRESCDEILGASYARRIGTCHHAVALAEDKAGEAWPRLISEVLNNQNASVCVGIEDLPRVVWSGDGGSVGLGRVYIDEAMIQTLRAGNIESAVRQFLARNKIAFCGGAMHPKVRRWYEERFLQAVIDEIIRHECADPGKSLFLFLLENDQRRHMALFYEEIDVNRVEYQMPFFDGEFLAAATALPLDATIYHRFYSRHWLRTFGESTVEVPWQAYPGHDSCPLPLPKNAVYQWRRNHGENGVRRRRKQALQALEWAFSATLPAQLFSRPRLAAIGLSAALIGRDYSYIFTATENFARYKKICQQRTLEG